MRIKLIIRQVIGLTIRCALLCGLLITQVQAASVAPSDQNTVVTMTFDKINPPDRIYVWNNAFGGSTDFGICMNVSSCKDQDIVNALVCYSTSDAKNGSCPVKLYWSVDSEPFKLMLTFTHKGTGQTRDVRMYSQKSSGNWSSWVSGSRIGPGFTTFITSDELKKLDLAGIWKAELRMRVLAWNDCSDRGKGCSGFERAKWTANITLNVVDFNNQQIYLPAFPTAAPVIDLQLVTRSGASSGKTVSGSTSLDMCLYDGNDSASNRISLLFQDEGATAAGRPKGQFSLYRQGGDKTKARDRLDYQISVINPTTGASQAVSNGTEIIWSDTNRRDIQRQVILPGVSTPALCVPAPLTLKTPTFSLADKTGGDYSGRLRIIYTPTIQTAQ